MEGTFRVVLCDLSERGAKIFAKTKIPCGRDVVLKWYNLEGFGSVQWQRDGFHGLHFEEPIASTALVQTRFLEDTQGMKPKEVAEWLAETGWGFGKSLI